MVYVMFPWKMFRCPVYIFQTELPYIEDQFESLSKKIAGLQKLNSQQSIPALEGAQQEAEERFAQATELADILDSKQRDYTIKRAAVQSTVEEQVAWLNDMRDLLAQVDDVSGQDEDLVTRLKSCKVSGKYY